MTMLSVAAAASALFYWPLAAAARGDRPVHQCSGPAVAADIVHGARQLCAGSLVVDSLRSVGVRDDAVGPLLQLHGFRTALDLRLLATDGGEAAELMMQLQRSGISIGDRSKVRLLLGEFDDHSRAKPARQAHLESDRDGPQRAPTTEESGDPAVGRARNSSRRQLQDTEKDMDSHVDTIAIVLTVLVGAIGYFVQGYTSRRAELAAKALAAEQHLADLMRERDHEQLKAQIARTDRCA
eukprot:SAG31_NODE_63_length_28659_cov_23.074685_1_plen_239_part_00